MIRHEMADQPLIDVVPCVGFQVERITPDDKYYDFSQDKTHYSLNTSSLNNELSVLSTIKTLNANPKFAEAKRTVLMKDMYRTDNEYNKHCARIANSMGINEKGLSPEQALANQLQNSIANGKQFDINNVSPTGVSSQFSYDHKMSAEAKQMYVNGSNLDAMIKGDIKSFKFK